MARLDTSRVCIALGVVLGGAWFLYNLNLPDLHRGRVCCDSVDYIAIADQPYGDLLSYTGSRTFGYPLFLKVHASLRDGLGVGAWIDWVTLASVTAFLLQVFTSIFLFRSFRAARVEVPAWILLLLLAHPGLASHAALPLTDSLTTSLLTFGVAAGCRALCQTRMRPLWALALGSALGAVYFVRPPLLLVVQVSLLLWLMMAWASRASLPPCEGACQSGPLVF